MAWDLGDLHCSHTHSTHFLDDVRQMILCLMACVVCICGQKLESKAASFLRYRVILSVWIASVSMEAITY